MDRQQDNPDLLEKKRGERRSKKAPSPGVLQQHFTPKL